MFWFFGLKTWDLSSQTRDWTAPPALEGEVLTTELPGKSLVNSSEAEGTRKRFLGRQALGLGFDVRIGIYFCVSLVAQIVKNLLAMQETQGWSLGREGPLEKEMAIHSSILAWRIPMDRGAWRLQSMGSHNVGQAWSNLACTQALSFKTFSGKRLRTHCILHLNNCIHHLSPCT